MAGSRSPANMAWLIRFDPLFFSKGALIKMYANLFSPFDEGQVVFVLRQ